MGGVGDGESWYGGIVLPEFGLVRLTLGEGGKCRLFFSFSDVFLRVLIKAALLPITTTSKVNKYSTIITTKFKIKQNKTKHIL